MKLTGTKSKKWFSPLLALSLFTCSYSAASETPDPKELFNLTLEELMSYQIETGTLTGTSAFSVPVARTVISAEDIAVTPARNLLDLLEVYVPGATFVDHFQGPRFGFRGIIGDQNFHYLLLVNGKNMNLKVEDGPIAEINNRDLNDVEKIEIIRGPGSVTYGSGAIGGVINIITHNADTSDGLKLEVEANERYRSRNAYLSYGKKDTELSYYFYGSVNRSEGNVDTRWYYVDREHGFGYGYMSPDWGNQGTGSPVPNYYSDALNKPQIKLHMDLSYQDWSVWARYTSASQYNMQEINHYQDGDDFASQDWQTFAIELKNTHSFNTSWDLETKIGFDSFSYRQIANWQGDTLPQKNLLQYYNNYSENEVNLKSLLKYQYDSDYQFAAGLEYSYEFWRAPWGKSSDDFIMDMRSPIRFATLSESSDFYQHYGSNVATVIDSPESSVFSVLAEANLNLHKYIQLLLSGRADKHTLSDWAFSPRIAWISNVTDEYVVKTVYQRSIRIPNFPELYTADYLNNPSPEPETIDNYEIMVGHTKDNFSWDANIYYNILDEVNWTENSTSEVTGKLKMWGVELATKLQDNNWTVGANYAYIKQDSWKWIDTSVQPTNIISNDADSTMAITDYGSNRLNNLPSNAIKLYWNHRWFEAISTHLDARVNWGYGQKELLKDYLHAHNQKGSAETQAEMNAIYEDMVDHGYGEPSFTMNISASWKLPTSFDARLTCYAQNLLSINNIRYRIQYYESLSSKTEYSRQSSFIDEPLAVGIRLDVGF